MISAKSTMMESARLVDSLAQVLIITTTKIYNEFIVPNVTDSC